MKSFIKYLIGIFTGLLIAFVIIATKGVFNSVGAKECFQIISDGFFISGALFLGFGLLTLVANQGAFDGISYLFHTLMVNHNWSKTRYKDKQSYKEYVETKRSNQTNGLLFILWIGLGLILIAGLMLYLYHKN